MKTLTGFATFARRTGSSLDWPSNLPGYKITLVPFKDGRSGAMEDFPTGFVADEGKNNSTWPVGVAVAADGSLLIADDAGNETGWVHVL